MGTRSTIGLATGAAIGLLWWAAYVPGAHSVPALVASHALAGAVLAGVAGALLARWRDAGASVLGVLGGLLLGPVLVVVPYALGRLSGASGLLAIAATMGAGALAGLELGRRGLLGVGALAVCGVLAVGANDRVLGARERGWHVPAQLVVDDFPRQPVAIIGIDGADFSVVDPMLESGALPHLAGLIARGQHGVLRSIEPTLSPVVWTTIFSGQPADVHGLRDWATSDNRNRRVPMLWDIFGAHGRTSIVVNVPGSWPPAPTPGARLLAGFPIPGIVSGGRGQLTGTFVSSEPDEVGTIATVASAVDSDGRHHFELPLAAPHLRPRFQGLAHPLIEAATRDRLIPVESDHFEGTVQITGRGVQLESDRLARPVELPIGAWSPWLALTLAEGTAHVRALVLEASHARLRMYLTPAFQDPLEPRYPFAHQVEEKILASLSAPYVVEGLGWRAHRDDRVVAHLPAVLADFERVHAEAALALLAESPADLFVYTITITDRSQHPFWRDHDLAPFGPSWEPHPGLEERDPVEEAYALADGILGEILAALPRDGLVFVVSDHGVAPVVASGEGGHRAEGIWVAAGPGIQTEDTRHELSILDVVPTTLRCIGAPLADDMSGEASRRLCPDRAVTERVASYREPGGQLQMGAGEARTIDETREEQLRSLGYIE